MTILAQLQNQQVEVLNVWTTGDLRKVASVRALRGEPFVAWSHGGYTYSRNTVIRADLLRNVVEVPDLQECACVLPEQSCPVCRIPSPALEDIYIEDL